MSQSLPAGAAPARPPRDETSPAIVLLIAFNLLLFWDYLPRSFSRRASNERAAVAYLREVAAAEARFRETHAAYGPGLDALLETGLLDGGVASGARRGYAFAIESAGEKTWSATATPEVLRETGDAAFFIDETGVMRVLMPAIQRANAADTPIGG